MSRLLIALLLGAGLLVPLGVVAIIEAERRDCQAGGGAYVRSVWGYECLPQIPTK